MAYLRREKETVEIDFPIDKVWTDIQKAVVSLDWTVEEKNDVAHQLKMKSKSNFLAYASVFKIMVVTEDEQKTRVSISAETPVTTITGIVDFGRTRERIDTFLLTLAKKLKGDTAEEKKE